MQEYDKALRQICQRLAQESQTNRQMPPAARWLLDNYGFLRTQARELREALSPKFWRKLALAEKADPDSQHNPRICRLITEMVERTSGKIEFEYLIEYFENFQNTTAVLSLAELWAVHPVLKLVLLESILKVGRPLAERGWQAKAPAPQAEEERIANAITSIRAIDQMSLKDFVEAVSGVEKTLRQDPTGVYGRMDFDSRDLYRRAVEEIAERSWCSEPEVAQMAIRMAKEAKTAGGDVRKAHVGYYLIGPGCRALRRSSGHGVTIREAIRDTLLKYPNVFYIGTVIVLMAALLWLTAALLLPPWWILLLLLIPVSQVAIQILNSVVGLALPPRRLPRLDLSGGVPDDSRTFVVVPTLLLSRSNVEELLERIEIHYLANRDGNLLFGLLTDFRDAPSEHTDNDDLAEVCAKGIRGLNDRYRANGRAPFYLFHRPRLWNASEGAWMGHERKRGKLEDFNQFLLGRADAFSLKVGDLDAIQDIRYVITLDTDTHLPRDSARELIATLYHHLNRAVFNDKDTVTEGYGLLQPRISVSMESAQRSRLARIYSGQTGLDPYTKAVSDVYQDLHGQATYTGKGIYDLAAFDRATRDRFPDNTLLSHDLIEGEHVRVGLVTDIELVDDFPTSYQAYSKRKHRWVRGDWQIAEWLLPTVPDGTGKKVKNPLGLLSRWKILDNLRRSLFEIALTAFFLVGMFSTGLAFRYSIAMLAILIPGAAVQMIISLLHFPPRRFWRAFLREVGWNFLQGLLEASLTIAFALHQALLMADAIVRTLVRRHYSRRKLLEWETMAQAAAGGNQLDIVNIYALLCPVIATVIAFFAALAHTGYELLPITILILWAGTPLLAEFVSSRMRLEADHNAKDTRFLRELSLQTWHYFVDYGGPDENWLVPDNVQFDPQAIATRASPTNIGLQLSANLAAFDFGYLTQKEVAAGFGRIFETLDRMERSRGHFYNWYDTRTLEPLHPLFISTVDSGNLAASLITIKQGCLDILNGPLLTRSARLGLMDYCGRLRQTLPHGSRTAQIMREINSLCKQLEYQPSELFAWAGLLTELDRMGRPLAEHMSWLCEHARQKKGDSCEEARYWIDAFNGRVKALREMLGELAPWVAGTLGLELRLSASDHRLDTLMALLNRMPKLSEWKAHHEAIAREVEQQRQAQGMVAATRRTLDDLAEALGEARTAGRNYARRLRIFPSTPTSSSQKWTSGSYWISGAICCTSVSR